MSRSFACLFALLPLAGADFSNPTRVTNYRAIDDAPSRLFPRFTNGYLISLPSEPPSAAAARFLIAGRDGKIRQVPAGFEESARLRFHNAAVSTAGDFAVTGSMIDREGRFVSFLSVTAAGKTALVRTNPYSAEMVTFAPDGSVWITVTRGDEGGGDDPSRGGGDFPVLRHYSKSGELLGTALSRATLTGLLPGSLTGDEGRTELVANKTMVGLLIGTSRRWITIGPDGRLSSTEFVSTGRIMGGVAFLDNGEVYSHQISPPHGFALYRLDMDGEPGPKRWVPVPGTVVTDSQCVVCSVLGADGDAVVYKGGLGAPGDVKWMDLSAGTRVAGRR